MLRNIFSALCQKESRKRPTVISGNCFNRLRRSGKDMHQVPEAVHCRLRTARAIAVSLDSMRRAKTGVQGAEGGESFARKPNVLNSLR